MAGQLQATPPTALSATTTSTSSDVWYEIFVRSWYDSDGDGVGDLNGVTAKLDYLQSLGVSGIWLMPINPSPSYHGYDITDYDAINPQYGSMADFARLLSEAHKRGIKVIIDLVINHTSDQHPWFKAARDPASPYHRWYHWAGPHTDLRAEDAAGSQAWHALGAAHYLGDFSSNMPDLDYDTPAVRQQMVKLGQYWLRKGVDGFRLDAAQHIYYDFKADANNPLTLQKNLDWWSEFRRGMNAVNPAAYIVGEVTRDSAAELAPYFKPLSAVFDFPLAARLVDSARAERAGDLASMLARTDAAYRKVTDKSAVDAPFLSNHDQQRVMSQLGGNAPHMRMAAAMLLTLPGHPFIYYGEELGMRGSKPDPNLREPMRWHGDPHDPGQTRWKTFSAGDSPGVSVDAEQADDESLLNYYRTLIGWRRDIGALRDGALRTWPLANPHIAAWQLDDAGGPVLVLHNLSSQAQDIPLGNSPFHHVLRHSRSDTTIQHEQLSLPPYSSAILN
ncbi:alpha-amylase family glycosyl hydrolase [Rhodanobacter sp. AS-Z3]|nr:alpha-amylase family glycosyl hydrolase [Rhodanobacter sp. AS-Z3]WEN16906.1 alpha-amylase family glycosyl hydrolase [Rhodanobacter sp. AS-Z3]